MSSSLMRRLALTPRTAEAVRTARRPTMTIRRKVMTMSLLESCAEVIRDVCRRKSSANVHRP